MLLRNLIVVIMLLFTASSWAQELASSQLTDPTILILHANDRGVFIPEDLKNMQIHMEDIYPEHRILAIEFSHTESESEVQNIVDKLSLLIKENTLITHLIIATHGNELKNNITSLSVLGDFSPTQQTSTFQRIFDPIKAHTASNLHIFLNSCLTFCGNDKQAMQKAEGLLRYFDAPQGVIFGANEKMTIDSIPKSREDLVFIRNNIMTSEQMQAQVLESLRTIKRTYKSGMMAFSFPLIYGGMSLYFWHDNIAIVAMSVGAVSLSIWNAIKLSLVYWDAYEKMTTEKNTGRFFYLKEGKVKKIEKVKMPRDFIRFFDSSPSCARYFL